MLITCSLEMRSWAFFNSFGSKVIVDVVKLFSALLIFTVMVLKKDVREVVFKSYNTLRSLE